MFGSLFSSKNQKLVKTWVKEHKKIVTLAQKIIDDYSKHKDKATKKDLQALNDVAINHLMTEDLEFFQLLKDQNRLNNETETLVKEFTDSFKDTKNVLIRFLAKYTQDNAVLDEEFIETFNTIVGVLAQRIEFEEKNLYAALSKK
jgi:hypothetical protein